MSPLGVTDPCGYKFDSGPAYWGRGESANTVLTTNFFNGGSADSPISWSVLVSLKLLLKLFETTYSGILIRFLNDFSFESCWNSSLGLKMSTNPYRLKPRLRVFSKCLHTVYLSSPFSHFLKITLNSFTLY